MTMYYNSVLTLKRRLAVQTAFKLMVRISTLEIDHYRIAHVGDPVVDKVDSTKRRVCSTDMYLHLED